MDSVFHGLLDSEINKIRALGIQAEFGTKDQVFREGDEADYLYFVDSGQVSLYIEKFNTKMEIQVATPGSWFGEMAVYSGSRRTASAMAVADSRLVRVGKDAFHRMLEVEPEIDRKLRQIVNLRNEKLVLEEKMVAACGAQDRHMHIGIKGDPSLRESAMERQRYESVVDLNLPALVARFQDLLLNRTAHRIVVGFNNGEIRVSTLLDPFAEEFHPALRLLDASYVERHFPLIDYQRKADFVRNMYRRIRADQFFADLPGYLHSGYGSYFDEWAPVSPESLSQVIAKLPQLRTIPNFYVRNVTLGMLKDVIHMQFNCDGTHIVSAVGYERFLEENL